MINYIALAVPFFFVAIGVELLVARRRGLRLYRTADAIADIGCGMSSQLVTVFAHGLLLAGYLVIYQRYRVTTFSAASPWPWLIAFVGVDLLYYWWHRLSHEVNFLWA